MGRNRRTAALKIVFIRIVFIHSIDYKKRICIAQYCTNQGLSCHIALTLSGWRRSSPRSGSRACRPCGRPGPRGSASRWRWAHGEEGGRRGDAGIGIKAFLSVFIHSVRRNKRFFLGLYTHQRSLWSVC